MGTVIPSSEAMCRKMTDFIDWEQDKVIVELGAGDGVITKHILSRIAPDAVLFAFEINPDLCKIISKINDPRLILVNADAQTMEQHLNAHGYDHADHIISAIPFLNIPEEITTQILNKSQQILKDQGLFIQMHYAKTITHLYRQVFDEVHIDYVPVNIPPGYVFKCKNLTLKAH